MRLLWCAVALVVAVGANTEYEQVFRSYPVTLHPGQVANTDDFSPIDFVEGPAAITYFGAEVVDDTGASVPLNEVYVHHWLIFADLWEAKLNSGPCTQSIIGSGQVFGIGAELRGTVYDFPHPYALVTTGKEKWTANLHFIRTEHVPDVQRCIECHCEDGTPDHPSGHIGCVTDDGVGCGDGLYCWSANKTLGESLPAKTYFLQYTIRWTNVTDETVPVSIFILDVTADDTVDCHIEYQVPASDQPNVREVPVSLAQELDVVLVEGHQHVGGAGLTLSYADEQKGTICTTMPKYGNGTTPGNEDGYVVAISRCRFDTPHTIPANASLKLTSVYTNRSLAGGHPEHEGVMGLMWIAAVPRKCVDPNCSYSGVVEGVPSPFSIPQGTFLEARTMPSLDDAMLYCDDLDKCAAVSVVRGEKFPTQVVFGSSSAFLDNDDDNICTLCSNYARNGTQCFQGNSTYAACATCGYGANPNGPNQCASCLDGYEVDLDPDWWFYLIGRCVPAGTAVNPLLDRARVPPCQLYCPEHNASKVWETRLRKSCTCATDVYCDDQDKEAVAECTKYNSLESECNKHDACMWCGNHKEECGEGDVVLSCMPKTATGPDCVYKDFMGQDGCDWTFGEKNCPNNDEGGGNSLSNKDKALIVIGTLMGAGLVGGALYVWRARRRNTRPLDAPSASRLLTT